MSTTEPEIVSIEFFYDSIEDEWIIRTKEKHAVPAGRSVINKKAEGFEKHSDALARISEIATKGTAL